MSKNMYKSVSLFLGLLIIGTLAFEHRAEAQGRRSGSRYKGSSKRISSFTGRSRFNKNRQYWVFGASVGAANYFGDIVPRATRGSFDISQTRPSIGINAGRRVHPNITLRGSFAFHRLRGDDFESASETDAQARARYIRNAHFRNDIKELTVTGMFDLFGNTGSYLRRADINPYAFVGVGAFLHNPRAQSLDGNWEALRPLGTEGQQAPADVRNAKGYNSPYSLVQVAVPFGIGVKYAISSNLDLALEIGYRLTFTDYLDDVSTFYPDFADLPSDLARQMTFRSAEPRAAAAGSDRNLVSVLEAADKRIISGGTYRGQQVPAGTRFVEFHGPRDIRGSSSDNDYYIVTGLHLSYLMGTNARRPKFR